MTIGIDIRVLGSPIKSGIEEYAENLIPNLIRKGRDINFKLFYSSGRGYLPEYNWLQESNTKLYKFNFSNNLLFTSACFVNRPFIDKMIGGADVFLFPHFFLSSLSPNCKRVTTFHDLSFLYYPEFLTLRKKIWHNLQMNPKWQAKFSDKIIAVSESTRNDLVNFYKIDPTRINVIYSGISKNFETNKLPPTHNQKIETTALEEFRRLKKLPKRFIFSLSKIEPRKNITNIIRAFSNVKEASCYKDLGLVVAGTKGWLCQEIFKEAKRSKYKNQIIFTGQISNEEKILYYQTASIFVYPSFFEGFGFPPLEAMLSGVPVIASRNSSMPEVLGNSAILVDPHNVAELELWITKILDDKNLSKMISEKGVKQASKFTWEDTATKTLEVLKTSLSL